MSKLMAVIVVSVLLLSSITLANNVSIICPIRPWEIKLDIPSFEPWDMRNNEHTILGGQSLSSDRNDIIITVIVEDVKAGTTAKSVRSLYGERYASGNRSETAERFDVNDIPVIMYQWATPSIEGLPSEEQEDVKNYAKDRWGVNGYVVKDTLAFDIHLSGDVSRKKDMLKIIKSFSIKDSSEFRDLKTFLETYGRISDDANKIELINAFQRKYPKNTEAQRSLAEYYLHKHQFDKAEQAYLKTLEYHKSQPMFLPRNIWRCYDGLGRALAFTGKVKDAEPWFNKGYDLAHKMETPDLIATSAYDMACVYGKRGDVANCVKFLDEAIKLEPEKRNKAKTDSPFKKIRNEPQFQELLKN